MVHGAVVGATLWRQADSFDEARVRPCRESSRSGDGSFLGVVARREEQAINARLALIEFRQVVGRLRAARSGEDVRAAHVPAQRGQVIGEKGGAVPVRRQGARGDVPSPIRRMPRSRLCAVAELKDGKLTVWTHSQGVFPLRATSQGARSAGARHPLHPRRGPGCYGTTAPTTLPSTPPCWRARQWAAGAAAMDA